MIARIIPSSQVLNEPNIKQKLKLLVKYGIYTPKNSELTPYRKSIIKKRYAEHKRQIQNPELTFVKFPKHTQNKKLRGKAEQLNFATTPSGIFVKKEGNRSGKIEFNRQSKEYEIKLSGRTKFGKRKNQIITETIPLASVDEIEKELLRIEKEFNSTIEKDGYYKRIKVTETGNNGIGSQLYTDVKALIADLEKYKKSLANRIGFYRLISIETVTPQQHKLDKQKPIKKRKVDKTGRSI